MGTGHGWAWHERCSAAPEVSSAGLCSLVGRPDIREPIFGSALRAENSLLHESFPKNQSFVKAAFRPLCKLSFTSPTFQRVGAMPGGAQEAS